MQASELRKKTADELKAELSGLLRERFNLQFKLHTRQLQQTDEVRKVRRNIARVNTVLAEKTAAQA